MRIGCLQFAPQVGDIDNNLNRADAVLSKSQDLEDLDILVLPELAFTGYNFRSLAHIAPYLEPSGSGISSLWARTTALKFNCNVVVGYPEKVDVANNWPASPEFYNSAIVVNRDGETIANYRKSFLYAVDETWALEGRDGFFKAEIPDLGNVAMGICMDINPYKFEAPWHAFEFSFHVLEMQANLVILTMAWTTRENGRAFTQLPQDPDLKTLEYWVQRLEPVIRSGNQDEIIFVICNRTGVEEECVYTGTSTVFGVKDGEVNLYGYLGRGVKQVLVVDTNRKPFAKIIKDVLNGQDVEAGNEGQHPSTHSSRRTSEEHNRSVPHMPEPSSDQGSGHNSSPDGSTQSKNGCSYGKASVSSVQVTRPEFTKPAQPKLGLHIPDDSQTTADFRRWIDPVSALKANDEEKDLPTPTGPSPTPTSMRPTFPLPEYHSSLPPIGDFVPSYVNSIVDARRTRIDTPITPPVKIWARTGKYASPVARSVLASPLVNEKLKPEDYNLANTGKGSFTISDTLKSNNMLTLEVKTALITSTAKKQIIDADKKAEEDNRDASPDPQLKRLNGLMKEFQELSGAQNLLDAQVLPHEIPRPASTKSRNASRPRADSALLNNGHVRSLSQSQVLIPIIASPSIFPRDARNSLFSESSVIFQPGNRNASVPRSTYSTERAPEQKHQRSLSRPVSRGRQPLSKNNPTNGFTNSIMPNSHSMSATRNTNRNATRSFSESTDRGRQSSISRSVISRGATSTASSVSWLFGTPPPKTEPALNPDDEIVAMINLINHNCPVHNSLHIHENDQNSHSRDSPNEENGLLTTQRTPAVDEIYEVILPPNIRELVESLSSPEPRSQNALPGRDFPKTSSEFEPSTPKAMQYDASLNGEVVIPAIAPVQMKQEC